MFHTKNILNRMMSLSLLVSVGFAALLSLAQTAPALAATAPSLGLVQQFGALGHSGVTAAGTAVVNGDVGSCPTPSITGAGLSTVPPFTIHPAADAVVCQAQIDATAASTNLLGQGPGTVLVAELGGTTRGPGVYSFASTANIAAGTTFTLSGAGTYVFLVASAVTANVGSNVALINVDPCQVFWRVGSDATLNGVNFPGTVIAGAAGAGSVTVGSGANLAGRAVSLTAAVTMPGTGQTVGGCSSAVLAPTTLSTQASPGVTLGGSISDTATLSGGTNPTGQITFNLYGPNDATCSSAAIFTSTVTVAGNGSYSSTPAFTPTAAGTYRWIANYSGDANNNATANACNGANENVVVGVGPAAPNVVTNASPSVTLGGSISDTATLSGGTNPTGQITFNLYGPNDGNCNGAVIFTSTVAVSGNGNYVSGSFTPTAAGTYRWIANYGGDGNNAGTANACNAANENVLVTSAVTAIPTLSEWGVIIFMVLVGLMSIYYLRRKRREA